MAQATKMAHAQTTNMTVFTYTKTNACSHAHASKERNINNKNSYNECNNERE